MSSNIHLSRTRQHAERQSQLEFGAKVAHRRSNRCVLECTSVVELQALLHRGDGTQDRQPDRSAR
jgi:nitric oxide synthase oxygenase domain/subunit